MFDLDPCPVNTNIVYLIIRRYKNEDSSRPPTGGVSLARDDLDVQDSRAGP